MIWQEAARSLESALSLQHALIGISRRDEAPDGAARVGRDLPSACAFWREGEHRIVYADANEHQNCPIGVLTMGFEPTEAAASNAQVLVGRMAELGYLDPAEVQHLPMLPRGHRGLLYGPARELPERPEMILVICSLEQAMIMSEALGQASLTPGKQQPVFGRPACSVIPRAFHNHLTEMSLACKGARILAELSPGEMLVAIPGDSIEAVAAAVDQAARANAEMESFYRQHRSQFAPQG